MFSAPSFADEVEEDDGDRIIVGTRASQGEIPYQVSLQVNGRHMCGGTIIADKWVVTAGHCVAHQGEVIPAEQIKIIYGSTSLRSPRNRPVQVTRVIIHPNYTPDSTNNSNDITLLQLQESVIKPGMSSAAELPSPGQEFSGTVLASGWGNTRPEASFSGTTELMKVDMKLDSSRVCQREWQNRWNPKVMICAMSPRVAGTCKGDSGGPLVVKQNGRNVLVGVVSFGPVPCAQIGLHSVYTKVSAYVDNFIQKNVRGN